MKRDKKHIDRLFQEKFKYFEDSPATDLWKNIEAKLDEDTNAKFDSLWWKISKIAAAIVLILSLIGLYQNNPFESSPIVNEGEIKLPETIEEKSLITSEDSSEPNSDNKSEISPPGSINKANVKTEKSSTLATTFETEARNSKGKAKDEVFLPGSGKRIELTEIFSSEGESSISSLAINEPTNQATKLTNKEGAVSEETQSWVSVEMAKKELLGEDKNENNDFEVSGILKKEAVSQAWSLKPLVSPVFNLASNSGSAIDPMLAGNNSQGNTSLSLGMLVTYQITPTIRVRSGVHQVGISYATNDIILAPIASGVASSNQVVFDTNFSGFNVYNESVYNATVTDPTARALTSDGSLQQQFGFLEIPMEIEWQLLEGKFGIYASGGASTLFLMNNSLNLRTNDATFYIGENGAANSTSFSGNIGLGLDYQLSRRFNLNLEPSFRYQLNTFSSQIEGFTPYFFAIYTGVNFRF